VVPKHSHASIRHRLRQPQSREAMQSLPRYHHGVIRLAVDGESALPADSCSKGWCLGYRASARKRLRLAATQRRCRSWLNSMGGSRRPAKGQMAPGPAASIPSPSRSPLPDHLCRLWEAPQCRSAASFDLPQRCTCARNHALPHSRTHSGARHGMSGRLKTDYPVLPAVADRLSCAVVESEVAILVADISSAIPGTTCLRIRLRCSRSLPVPHHGESII
jgi:hypothetical protein